MLLSIRRDRFNSKLVRLKGNRSRTLYLLRLFQFQTGAIRSSLSQQPHINPELFQFQTGAIRSIEASVKWVMTTEKFQFQTGAIRSIVSIPDIEILNAFQFQTGAIRRMPRQRMGRTCQGFDSKLVRLEGCPKTTLILYCTLTVPVKLIFIFIRLEGSLLSTSNRANSLGG